MLNRNFQGFVKLLNARGVKYLVVGGYAVAFHGFPRYTGDIDFLVAPTCDNAEKIVQVFSDFGFPNSAAVNYFLEPDANVAFGEPPQRIHLLTGIAGVTFDECYASRQYFENEGEKIPFIGIDALIRAKEALKRDQDELDLKRLRRLRELQKKNRNQDLPT